MASGKQAKYIFIGFIVVLAALGVFRIFSMFTFQSALERSKVSIESDYIFQSKEAFGRALFFDKRLSLDNSISCASCHHPEKAFTDGKVKSIGVGGRIAFRNASTLLNVGDAPVFMFDAHIESLHAQAIVPIQDTSEMSIPMGDLIRKLQGIEHYSRASEQLYDRELDAWVVTRALASFQKTLISNKSPFDSYLAGNKAAISEEAQKGWVLFNDLQCIECHSFPHFTNYQARNNGLYHDYGNDSGKFRIAGDSTMIGAFKVPSLRNIALTAPYMHDGSMSSLSEVIEHYNKGGVGHSNQDWRIKKRNLNKQEINNLIIFLETLTDTSYMHRFR